MRIRDDYRALSGIDKAAILLLTMGEEVSSKLFARMSDEEMVAGVGGQWCDYRLHVSWSDDLSALHFSCALDLRVPAARQAVVSELLATINGKLWVGHFDLSIDDRLPVFRHTVLLRGAQGATVEQLDVLHHATSFGVKVQEFTGVARATHW